MPEPTRTLRPLPIAFRGDASDLHPVWAKARLDGVAALSAWEEDGRPPLCPCCGRWTRADGTAGARLPSCADRVTMHWEADPREGTPESTEKVTVWRHSEVCIRIAEADYSKDPCAICAAAEGDDR